MDESTYNVASEAEVDSQENLSGSNEEVQALLQEMAEQARDWREEHLDPFLEEANDYYRGELPEPESEDRSQIVITDVRDAIRATMPSLMRVFFGPENVVEFVGRGREDAGLAKQQTDMTNIVVREDNPGFLIFHSWFKDALKNRIAWVKWWWEDHAIVKEERFEGLTLAEVGQVADRLSVEPGVEDVQLVEEVEGVNEDGEVDYDLTFRFVSNEGRVKFDCVPPEEMIWNPAARSLEDAVLVGHMRDVPLDMLRDMEDELDQEIVEANAGSTGDARLRTAVDDKRRVDEGGFFREETRDENTDFTQYAELYARIDADGDGIAELRLFKCVGMQFEIANGNGFGELVDEIPFAVLTPEPEPHALVGLSMTDMTMDLQKIKSYITRASLDSLAHAIDPVTEVVANEVNMKDVMSRQLSRVIRARRPGMIREVPHRWVGEEALAMLSYLDSVKEDRTGRGKAAAGLDPSVMQSSTKAAVMATVTGAQQQLELIARIFAETGVSQLYKGILRLLVKHQDSTRRRTVRLRGEWIPMDPSRWDATMDVQVNVALGSGLIEDKLATLGQILETQIGLIQMGAPIVSWRGIRTTLSKMVELGGWPSADDFYEPFGPMEQQQYAQMQAQQGQQPDPQTMLVQVEQQRLQQDAQEAALKLALDERKLMLEDDRERDKMARQFAIDSEKLKIDAAGRSEEAQLKAMVEADRNAQDADVKRQQAAQQPGPASQ